MRDNVIRTDLVMYQYITWVCGAVALTGGAVRFAWSDSRVGRILPAHRMYLLSSALSRCISVVRSHFGVAISCRIRSTGVGTRVRRVRPFPQQDPKFLASNHGGCPQRPADGFWESVQSIFCVEPQHITSQPPSPSSIPGSPDLTFNERRTHYHVPCPATSLRRRAVSLNTQQTQSSGPSVSGTPRLCACPRCVRLVRLLPDFPSWYVDSVPCEADSVYKQAQDS